MAVDADPSDAAITASRTVVGGEDFEVSIHITSGVAEYNTYQAFLEWDPAVLAYVSGAHLNAGGYSVCFAHNPTSTNVATACGRAEGPSNFTGELEKFTFRCVASGTSELHLVDMTEDLLFGSTTFDAGGVRGTETADATITCQ